MGSLCSCIRLPGGSKGPSTYTGGHNVLGAGVGDSETDSSRPDDPRAAALLAAEARLDASKKRGMPNQGALAQAASRPPRREPLTEEQEERLVWD